MSNTRDGVSNGDPVVVDNKRLNQRVDKAEADLSQLKGEVAAMNTELERMRVALFGHDGRNGFRGEMKKNQAVMEAKLEHIDKKLDEMIPRAVRIAAASLAGVSALAALVAAIIQAGGVI